MLSDLSGMPPSGRRGRRCSRGRRLERRYIETDDVASSAIVALQDYWQRLHRDRRLPAKRDIDPAEIKPLLPYLVIAEIHWEPLRVRYRLVGTEAARFAGADYTGQWLHETGWGEAIAEIETNFRRVAESGRPLFGADRILWVDDKWKHYEWAMLPLSDDGTRVTHCLIIEDFRHFERPSGRVL